MELDKLTEQELDELRDEVQREIEIRIKGPKKRVWYTGMNGGRSYHKSLKNAVKEAIDDLENMDEDDDVFLRFDNDNIPEKDYDLRPDSWCVG